MLQRFFVLLLLTALVIAQPIFDIFTQNLDFIVAWRISNLEVVYIVLLFYVAVPVILSGILMLAFKLSPRLGQGLFYLFAFVLITVFFLQIFKQMGLQQAVLVITLSSGIGLLFSYLLIKKTILQNYIRYFAGATVLIPILFIYFLASAGFFIVQEPDLVVADKASKNPVVLLLYDELPLVTLLNKNGDIDNIRFPNMAKFAQDSVWYQNTNSKASHTTIGVPQIVTGVIRKDVKPPNYKSYPNTLFSLLSSTHHINDFESIIQLCPPNLSSQEKLSTAKKALGFLYDTSLVYLYLTLPDSITLQMKPVNMETNDFGGFLANNLVNKKVQMHQDLLASIKQSNKKQPQFFYMHNQLPHVPHIFKPSGKMYTSNSTPGLTKNNWTTDQDWLVVQGYQRHILQSMYVDKMFGEVIDALKRKKLYDNALIIVTTDHGASYWVGKGRRDPSKTIKSDIYNVPLFVKYPNSKLVGISYDDVTTLDILPTVADVLKLSIPFKVYGKSLLKNTVTQENSTEKSLNQYVNSPSLNRKIALFGEGDESLIYKVGQFGHLVGTKVKKDSQDGKSSIKPTINNLDLYSKIDLTQDLIPSRITGKIVSKDKNQKLHLAIAINDIVCGVTETYPENDQLLFNFLVSDECFKNGKNKLMVFEITNDLLS